MPHFPLTCLCLQDVLPDWMYWLCLHDQLWSIFSFTGALLCPSACPDRELTKQNNAIFHFVRLLCQQSVDLLAAALVSAASIPPVVLLLQSWIGAQHDSVYSPAIVLVCTAFTAMFYIRFGFISYGWTVVIKWRNYHSAQMHGNILSSSYK